MLVTEPAILSALWEEDAAFVGFIDLRKEHGSVAEKKLKVGLIMGGGVSLGAFNGGAIAEIVKQLRDNLNPEAYEKAEIDVLSGASAGGMTLGLLLKDLANPQGLSGEEVIAQVRTSQREAWVERINLESLVREPGMEHASLLDRQAVDDLARELIRWEPDNTPHPEMLAERVDLIITLLNYNGIPIKTSEDPALADPTSTTLYRDYRCFYLDFAETIDSPPDERWVHYGNEELSEPKTWYDIAATAVAGGAFPLAFEPAGVERGSNEYGDLWPKDLRERERFCFTFGDGGAFDNEPLREASRMASLLDAREQDPDSFDRILIYVDPILSGTNQDFSLAFNFPLATDRDNTAVVDADPAARLLGVASGLAGAVRSQSAYKDFLAADKVNNRLDWRVKLREQLEEMAALLPQESVTTLTVSAKQRLEEILDHKRSKSLVPPPGLNTEAELQRVGVAKVDRSDEATLGDEEARVALVGTLLSIVDQVADLRSKQEVRVIAVGPTGYRPPRGDQPVPVNLAGDFRNNFGGFMLERFRVHDFQAGEAMAGWVLASFEVAGPEGANKISLLNDPDARPTYEQWSGKDPDIGDVPEEEKERLIGRGGEIVERLVRYLFRNKRWARIYGAVGESLAERWVIPRALSVPGPPEDLALIELVISAPDQGEFYLQGQGEGHNTAYDKMGTDGRAVLRTVVKYSLKNSEVKGPHVLEHKGEWHVQLRERLPLEQDPLMFVRLPSAELLRDAARSMALPYHSVKISWSDRSCEAWECEDRLPSLATALAEDSGSNGE
jgi:hypothetical protein